MRCFAIIPAAGRSERMGQCKLLLPWGNTTLLEHVLGAWRASRAGPVTVTLQQGRDDLARRCLAAGAEVAWAETPPPDMKASVRIALAEVERAHAPLEMDAWLLAPADLPGLSAAVIDRLVQEHERLGGTMSGQILAPVIAGKRGHPVLFPWPLAREAARLGENEGIDALVRKFPIRLVDVTDLARPDAFADVDTPEEYHKMREA